MGEKKLAGYIDLAPNWKCAARVYMAVLQNPDASFNAVKAAEADLMNMAALADKYNESQKFSGFAGSVIC